MTTSKNILVGIAMASLGAFGWACASDDTIDGSKVAPVGSDSAPPTCDEVCTRLAALCGYAPVGCVETCGAPAEENGWDDAHRTCKGSAASCRDALECANAEAEEEGDAGEEEAGDEDAGDSDASPPDDASAGADAPDAD